MKISKKQLQMLFQIAIDSTRINIVNSPFSYTSEQRAKLVNEIMDQQGNEIIDIEDPERHNLKEPALKPQYYKDNKKAETREEYLKIAVSLLRDWRSGENGAAQFLRTTKTIEFLDKYDKAVFIKEAI